MVKIVSIEAIRRAERQTAKQVMRNVYAEMDWVRDRIHDGTFELKDWYDELCGLLKELQEAAEKDKYMKKILKEDEVKEPCYYCGEWHL